MTSTSIEDNLLLLESERILVVSGACVLIGIRLAEPLVAASPNARRALLSHVAASHVLVGFLVDALVRRVLLHGLH